MILEMRPVSVRIGIVLGEDVHLDLHETVLAHSGHGNAGLALSIMVGAIVMVMMIPVIMVVVIMSVTVVMVVPMLMPVFMLVVVGMGYGLTLDPRLSVGASANAAHQFTSSSLIRISSPAVTCN